MNKRLPIVRAVLLLSLLVVPGLAAGSEVRVSRLGDKAAVFQAGGADSNNVLALASRRGLVVIDTGLLPAQGQALRTAIEREFRRRDFAYVINTHAHFDHTNGNQAFADVPIIGHANAAREMARWSGTKEAREAFAASRTAYRSRLEEDLKKAAPGSAEAADLRESAANNAALVEAFRTGELVPTPPTLLFDDRLTLDLGDLTLELLYLGPAHTTSDIFVHIPELRLLATGDVFHKEWLPQIEGPVDPARWLRVLASLPSGSQAVETIIPGHDAFLTGDELRAREAYVKSVWDGVASARQEGLTLAAAKAGLPFDEKNPLLAGLVRSWQGRDFHTANIEAAWRLQASPASADRAAEWEDVRKTISACIGWAKDKNLDLFYSVIAHDDDYVSVSPGARIVKRFEDVRQNVPFWMSPDFRYVRHELKDLEITFSRGGDVAWFFCILDDINTYKGEPASWENARWTGTVEKRDGRWVIVQQHFSFAQER